MRTEYLVYGPIDLDVHTTPDETWDEFSTRLDLEGTLIGDVLTTVQEFIKSNNPVGRRYWTPDGGLHTLSQDVGLSMDGADVYWSYAFVELGEFMDDHEVQRAWQHFCDETDFSDSGYRRLAVASFIDNLHRDGLISAFTAANTNLQ